MPQQSRHAWRCGVEMTLSRERGQGRPSQNLLCLLLRHHHHHQTTGGPMPRARTAGTAVPTSLLLRYPTAWRRMLYCPALSSPRTGSVGRRLRLTPASSGRCTRRRSTAQRAARHDTPTSSSSNCTIVRRAAGRGALSSSGRARTVVTGWRRVLLVLRRRLSTAGDGWGGASACRVLTGCRGSACLCYARYGYGNCYNASF